MTRPGDRWRSLLKAQIVKSALIGAGGTTRGEYITQRAGPDGGIHLILVSVPSRTGAEAKEFRVPGMLWEVRPRPGHRAVKSHHLLNSAPRGSSDSAGRASRPGLTWTVPPQCSARPPSSLSCHFRPPRCPWACVTACSL